MRVALQNRPNTPLQRAEPVPMLMAQTPDNGTTTGEPGTQPPQPEPFDGLGRFFGGLFGNNPPPPPAPPPPQQSAQAPPDFFTARRPNMAAPTPNNTGNTLSDGGNTSANTSNGSNAGGNITSNTDAEPRTQGRRNLASSLPPTDPNPGPGDSSSGQAHGYASPYGNSRPPRASNRVTPPAYPSVQPPAAMPAPYSSNDSAGPLGQNQIPPNFPQQSVNSPAQPQSYGNSRAAQGFNRATPSPDLSTPNSPRNSDPGQSANSETGQATGNTNSNGPAPDQSQDSSDAQQSDANPEPNPG